MRPPPHFSSVLLPAIPAIVLVAGMAGWAPAVHSQVSPGDTLRLSLADVLTQVRDEDPIWKAGSARVVAARARAAERNSNPWPTIRLGTSGSSDVRLELLQPLRWPWEGSALKAIGVQDVAVATADAEADRRGGLLKAGQRFADGLRSTRALGLAVEAESLAQHTVDQVVAENQPDQAADLAGLQTLVSLDEARRARVRAALQHSLSQSRLAVLLGRDPGTSITFDGELAAIAPLTAPEAALASALATDPKAVGLEHEAERAVQESRLARARRWPALAVGPSVTVGDHTDLGVALGFAIPAWKRQREAVRAARAERDTALARVDLRHRELSALITEALVTLTRAKTELALLRGGTLARAARALRLAEEAAPQRGAYVLAWLAAREAYLTARAAELDLEWEAAEARILLRHLTGSLIMEAP